MPCGGEWHCPFAVVGGVVDHAEAMHPAQHVISTLQRPGRIAHWIDTRGGLGQSREHGQLGQGQFAKRFVVVEGRRRLEAERPVAEEDLVDVQFKNLRLIELTLEPEGQQSLFEFAAVGFFPGKEIIAGDLHRDRACALACLPGLQVNDKRPYHPERIHPVMTEKAVVFRRQNGIDQFLGGIFNLYGNTPFISEFAYQPAVDAVNPERLLEPDILHLAGWREIGPDHGNDGDERH